LRTIIAGSRSIESYIELLKAISKIDFKITVVISGGAHGADKLGEKYAKRHGIPLEIYEANWDRYGKGAGHIRNSLMADKAEALICLWDGKSNGSANMIKKARVNNLITKVFIKGMEGEK